MATSIENKGVTVPSSATLDDYAALVDQIQTGGTHSLPQGAVQITYIQGDGSAFIDTGIKGSSDIQFRMDVYFTSSLTNANGAVLGSRISNGNAALTVQYYNTSSSKSWRWAFGTDFQEVGHSGTRGNYTISNLDRPRVLVTTNAKELTVECTDATFSNNLNIYILAMNSGGSTGGIGINAYTRIKNCKIWESYELVRDYIPIRIGQVGYLFDKVSGQSFGNANSTGAFVLGADVT